jgi:hypothetical protein
LGRRSKISKKISHRFILAFQRPVKRRLAILILGVKIGFARTDQQLGHGFTLVSSYPRQWCLAVVIFGVDVGLPVSSSSLTTVLFPLLAASNNGVSP